MKISETGRSMVEMLGVLAIMGVLTVGVMLGYRYAMDRILTNSIITGVRARSVIIGQQRVLGHPLNLSEFHPDTEKDLIYGRFEVKAFNNYEYDGEASQAMEVYNIPRRVCENIRMLTFPDETVTLVNGSEMGECLPDGPRENTGGLHDGGDYFTAEYHNVVTFIFAGLGEACSGNQDCLEGLCCVSLEEGGRGCLPCEDPTDCDPCQEWKDGKCVNKAEGARCLWTPARDGCCTAGVCGACPDRCEGNTCDRLCQTCDSATGECVNHPNGTGCGVCKQCKDGACVSDMTLPGCTPQCTADADCSGGACCCTDGTCSTDCCGTSCFTDDDCHFCEQCTGGRCVPNDDKGMCSEDGTGSCAMCQGGKCVKRPTKPIKLCNGTIEDCCLWNDNTKCEDETGCVRECTETPGPCQKCDTTTGKLVPDKEGESCGTCGTCTNGECQDSSIGNYYDPSETPSTQKCCAANSVPIKGWGYVKYPGSDNQWRIEATFCCPAGTRSWADNENRLTRCCAGDAVTKTGTSRSFCCPIGSKYVAKNGDCCSYDPLSTGSYLNPSDGSDVCCPENSVIEQVASSPYTTKDYCCPAGTTVWAKNEEGSARCCAQKNVRGYCCPESTEYAIQGTCCDSNTMGVLYNPAQNPSPEMCCPTGSVKINARGTGIFHNGSETGLIDFCCPAGTTRWAQNEEGEARCCTGTVLNGKCYEPGEDLCADITCGVCEVCQEGKCVSNGDACCGVTCGSCEECQDGRCISRCQSTEKCEDNVCVPKGKCDDLIGDELTCCQNDKVWCNGTCLETGCCDDALPESGQKACYKCNYTTHKWYVPKGVKWCPVSQQCITANDSRPYSCCNHMSWWPASNCEDIDATWTCASADPRPPLTVGTYYECSDNFQIDQYVHGINDKGYATGAIYITKVAGDGSVDLPVPPPGKEAKYYETTGG